MNSLVQKLRMSSFVFRFRFFTFTLSWTFALSNFVFADVHFLPRIKEDLPTSVIQESLDPVRGAQVAYFNRHALERDFPFLKGLSDEAIETWILNNCAYMSRTQLEFDSLFQTPVPVENPSIKRSHTAFRPFHWNRATVIPVFDNQQSPELAGLIDVKGIGLSRAYGNEHVVEYLKKFESAQKLPTEEERNAALDKIRVADHANGLASLGEAIAEITRQEVLQRSFNQYNQDHHTNFQTIEHYFIIALPFDVLRDQGQHDAAALIGRQAHFKRTCQNIQKTPDDLYVDFHGFKQSDLFGSAVDMGGVFPTDPAIRSIFLTPEQIDVLSRLKDYSKEYSEEQLQKIFDPQESNAWVWGHDTAKAFREGPHNHRVVYTHLEKMLGVYHQQAAPTPLVRDWMTLLTVQQYDLPLGDYVSRTVLEIYPWSEETWSKIERIFSEGPSPFAEKNVSGIFMGLLTCTKPPQEILDRLVDLWLKALKNENREIREAAVRGLDCWVSPTQPEILETLFQMAQDFNHPEAQENAMAVLGGIHHKGQFSPEFRAKLIQLCLQLLKFSHTDRSASSCLWDLSPLDQDTVQGLIALIRDPQERTRSNIMDNAFHEIPHHPTLRLALIDALIDSIELPLDGGYYRSREEEILPKLLKPQDDAALRRLLELARKPKHATRRVAICAFRSIQPSNPEIRAEAISTFMKGLRDLDELNWGEFYRNVTTSLLAQSIAHEPEILAEISQLEHSDRYHVRKGASIILRELGKQ